MIVQAENIPPNIALVALKYSEIQPVDDIRVVKLRIAASDGLFEVRLDVVAEYFLTWLVQFIPVCFVL